MTSVEFLLEEIKKLTGLNIANDEPIVKKAKEMEKKDICHFGAKCCFMTNQKKSWTIEELYNETFENK
jgi:hypothetical protein